MTQIIVNQIMTKQNTCKLLTGLLSVIQHLQKSQNFLGWDFQYSDLKNIRKLYIGIITLKENRLILSNFNNSMNGITISEYTYVYEYKYILYFLQVCHSRQNQYSHRELLFGLLYSRQDISYFSIKNPFYHKKERNNEMLKQCGEFNLVRFFRP